MTPNIKGVYYIESNSGPQNWYRVMVVNKVEDSRVFYSVVDSNDQAEHFGVTTLTGWDIFKPKDVTNDYPEYLL